MNEANNRVRLGERIKAIRAQKNMTQNELAIQCNFEKATMSRIESGQSNPTLRTLYKISTALDVHVAELFKD
jgi:transcriptional regulator with XRE-family HTH domain